MRCNVSTLHFQLVPPHYLACAQCSETDRICSIGKLQTQDILRARSTACVKLFRVQLWNDSFRDGWGFKSWASSTQALTGWDTWKHGLFKCLAWAAGPSSVLRLSWPIPPLTRSPTFCPRGWDVKVIRERACFTHKPIAAFISDLLSTAVPLSVYSLFVTHCTW